MRFYVIFHLNLMYSSIEESSRAEVIDKCYVPLLELARSGVPVGIEATGLTLEIINNIKPSWLLDFSNLLHKGLCEFIGSGYAQMIGPLWPAKMNRRNLEIGHRIYSELLGIKPKIALVNEQAYSAGLVGLYLDTGYEAILMEWDNPYRYHQQWNPKMRYFPQRALGADGRGIPVIWNHSISFQKFQRCAHAEIEIEEYLSYIRKHLFAAKDGAFSLYGNDAEIFDYRPGRFHTEAPLSGLNEWRRIGKLLNALGQLQGVEIVPPSAVLSLLDNPQAGKRVRLETPHQPIPVKKQEKYNIFRWGLTGRCDLLANTLCYHKGKELLSDACRDEHSWKELLYLCSSDFRTHITDKRWHDLTRHLARITPFFRANDETPDDTRVEMPSPNHGIRKYSRFMELQTDCATVILNLRKGLSFESIVFKDAGPKPLICTLAHGYYDDIEFGADFFSGHMVYERIGDHKITDLEPVAPAIRRFPDRLSIKAKIPLPIGPIEKTVTIYMKEPRIDLSWQPLYFNQALAVLRMGHITLNPEAFCRDQLFFASHNGGRDLETYYPPRGCAIEHGRPVSFLVSASQALGLTEGLVVLGDDKNRILIRTDKAAAAALGMITFKDIIDSWFCRFSFSLQEFDDTSKTGLPASLIDFPKRFTISITYASGGANLEQKEG